MEEGRGRLECVPVGPHLHTDYQHHEDLVLEDFAAPVEPLVALGRRLRMMSFTLCPLPPLGIVSTLLTLGELFYLFFDKDEPNSGVEAGHTAIRS